MNSILLRSRTSSRGFSLIELMVALVIALIITIGVVQIFSANRASYQLDEALARAQENGRFAMEFLSQEIRVAGYLGCNRDVTRTSTQPNTPIFNTLNGGGQLYIPRGIQGFEYTQGAGTGIGATYNAGPLPINNATAGWTPTLDTLRVRGDGTTFGAQPGTDVIAVEHFATVQIPLAPPYVNDASVFVDPASWELVHNGDILLINDCRQATIFQVTDVTSAGVISHIDGPGSPGNQCAVWERAPAANPNANTANCTNPFETPGPNLELGMIQQYVFYVARGPGNCATPGACQPTLYRNVLDPSNNAPLPPQALVEGVENLQVLYGVDDLNPDGIADHYVTANQVTNWSLVTSVRIGLLVHGTNATGSVNDATTLDKNTYNVAETIVDPNTADEKLRRRVFTTTIQLRNRGF
jgi:type IV pilus assembly protein PilW